MDWGNHFFVGTVLAQLLNSDYNVIIMALGVIFWMASFFLGVNIK